ALSVSNLTEDQEQAIHRAFIIPGASGVLRVLATPLIFPTAHLVSRCFSFPGDFRKRFTHPYIP
ncbi:MAG TPA: hypothetical protein VHD63_00915, partial [Ktedonobacteraceae bacterium]|nr:hypothetical protein [Ktedonobacteraceae bacterium]